MARMIFARVFSHQLPCAAFGGSQIRGVNYAFQ